MSNGECCGIGFKTQEKFTEVHKNKSVAILIRKSYTTTSHYEAPWFVLSNIIVFWDNVTHTTNSVRYAKYVVKKSVINKKKKLFFIV